jgi:putative methionine-R-sulfoxide reductase with GAF domain
MGNSSLEQGGKIIEGRLGAAITALQSKLLSMKGQESKQNWVALGVNSIARIRKSETEIKNYTIHVIGTLAKHLGASQAAFFILEGNEILRMSATYAYDKRSHGGGNTEISTGNGVLGQCVIEKALIHVTQVPINYVKINSGLGEATPKCLVVAPLIYREQVYGVIEIASLKDFESEHIEFIQKSSEEIA